MTNYLLILITILQIADIATTYIALSRKIGTESNGVLAWLFDKVGMVPTLLVTKGAFIGLLWATAPYQIVPVLAGLALLYGIVIWNNLKVLGVL